MATGEAGVHRVHAAFDADTGGVHVGEEHGGAAVFQLGHDDRQGCALSASDEPLAAVDHEVVAVAYRQGLQHRRVGAGAGIRLCHAETGTDLSGGQRPQPAFLLRVGGDCFQQVHVAFVRCCDIQRNRAEGGIAGFLEEHRLAAVIEAETAILRRHVGREQAGAGGGIDQFAAQVFAGTVGAATRILLEGNYLGGDEIAHPRLQCGQFS
ncbi:hypothetical protein D3C84_766180 [compost metagenome]